MATPPAVLLALAALVLAACSGGGDPDEDAYPPHRDVTATVFWVGEPPSEDNDEIANDESYWDADWEEHFGGFDDPDHRTLGGSRPAAFTPARTRSTSPCRTGSSPTTTRSSRT
jgi:hypothetical protein